MSQSPISYPKQGFRFILFLMILAVTALFATSFAALFPTTTDSPPRQAMTGQPGAEASNDMAAGLSAKDAETIGRLMAQLQKSPEDTGLLLDIGTLFLDNAKYEQARMVLTKAVALDPKDIDARMILGRCLYLQDNIQGAAAIFEDVLAMQAYPPAQINLGILYSRHLNKKTEAKKLFEAVLAQPDPNNALAVRAKEELAELNP